MGAVGSKCVRVAMDSHRAWRGAYIVTGSCGPRGCRKDQ